jgi:hypothetical protein
MRSQGDQRERNEALRLFIAAAVSLLLLIVVGGAGFYYIMGIGDADPFSAGLGLKNAALISFGVSFVAILIMAVVSGGDAILGGTAVHHCRLSDLLRDLLADDRLDLLATAPDQGSEPSWWRREPWPVGPRPRQLAGDNICAWSRTARAPAGAPHRL